MVGSRRLSELTDRVLQAVRKGLESDQSPLVVALSGGADSAVLAWATRELDIGARAVHVNHGWPASDRMAEASRAIASVLQLDYEVVVVDTTGPGSSEAVARTARYRALEEVRAPEELVATAHTLTDQGETVVGNLMWGTGLDGLAGIHPRRGSVIRPLLAVTRSDVRELATLRDLGFEDDPANEDRTFRRVEIRRAMAAWESELAPGIIDRLAQTADLVRQDVELLEEITDWVRIEQAGGAVRIPSGPLRTLPQALAQRVVRRALRVINDGQPGSRADVESVLSTLRDGKPSEISGGHRVTRIDAAIQIGTEGNTQPDPVAWTMPSSVSWGQWRLNAAEYVGKPRAYPLSEWSQVFDAEVFAASSGAGLRTVAPGDVLALRSGRKSATEALAESGIPAREHSSWPVVEANGEIVWLPGVRRGYSGWVTDATERYLVLSAAREERWKPLGS